MCLLTVLRSLVRFLWIMGFAVAMSYDHMVTVRHFTRLQLMLKVARRCFLLMLLGMIAVNWLMPLDYVRVPGTLQRIGVCYLVLSLMLVFIPRSSSPACRKCCGGSSRHRFASISFVFVCVCE